MNEKLIKADVLLEIVKALNQGAAGPTDYWFRQLAERLNKRIDEIIG